ncbi:MAG: bifunctional diaminohydroxyphosphoribosylaminopyrimidine deaminase/5-amino-6-(5-phosphoribosylamino)uracil reductase RibD [Alphaproteobacteria bacterium]
MDTSFSSADHRWMALAVSRARRGLGRVWPRPAVGCVLVGDDSAGGRRLIAAGHTGEGAHRHTPAGEGGRPHAEAVALDRAGPAARGATAYVTLEPCAHAGDPPKTPCAERLIAAGVSRVVSAMADPDSRVAGRGHKALRAAGITVDSGLLGEAAAALNAGFLQRLTSGRPFVTLKLASSLDGRIATAGGESRWITGPQSRAHAHGLRLSHDAVLVGIGTALSDDPALTCRLPGIAADDRLAQPVRIVVDPRLDLPPTARLLSSAAGAVWLLADEAADGARRRRLEDLGARILALPSGADGLAPSAMLQALGAAGLTRVLVEGGAGVAGRLLAAGLVDQLVWYRAPLLVGGDGVAAVGHLNLARLADARRFRRLSLDHLGADVVETLQPVS